MPVWPSRDSWPSLTFRGFLWAAVGTVFVLSFLLYSPATKEPGTNAGPMDWLFQNWPALFAAACAMWLLVTGPVSRAPSWIQKACRVILVFFVYSGFLYFLRWPPFWTMMQSLGFASKNKETGVLILIATIVWMIATVRVIAPGGVRLPSFTFGNKAFVTQPPRVETTLPKVTFANVGGYGDTKEEIRAVIQNRLYAGNLKRYGVVRNGILLHGPRGTGKSFLAEATAGEFGLNYFYVSPSQLTSMWVGGTENNIRGSFSQALKKKPVLMFIDEIDTLGAARVNIREAGDLGGSNRGYNDAVVQLMQSIDQHRGIPGFVLMGATNLVESLDPALVREGRFDVHIRVDLPDESSRAQILKAQLSGKPWRACNLDEFAKRTPGASAAKIKSIVDRAAAYAAGENREIEERDLRRALDETGGRDRPLFQRVEWHDLIVEDEVERRSPNAR